MKAVLTSLDRHGLSANISVTFQATLNLYAYFINHCLAVFFVNIWVIFEHIGKEIFCSQRIGLD